MVMGGCAGVVGRGDVHGDTCTLMIGITFLPAHEDTMFQSTKIDPSMLPRDALRVHALHSQ